jgi:toluene monooxygenase system protein A
MMLERSEWYDIARRTNWTPKYVTEEELFPPEMSDPYGVSNELWETYDEPYKVSYTEYVSVQREKDLGTYSVKAAVARQNFVAKCDERWRSILKFHFGAVALAESIAQIGEARLVRFGKAPGMRNMATFGLLDELRHAQIQLSFPHEWVAIDRQFAWTHKALHTNEWGAIATRHLLDDIFVSRDATTTSVMLTFAFETAFTNMQFLALAADAAKAGDVAFSSVISSIQTDEARHAQIGAPVLSILVKAGKTAEAQKILDISFWRTWKLFSLLTGMAMDYYTPLEHREGSFKEFMQEWILGQFERTVLDLGLERPWYWDILLDEIEFFHHAMHLGSWTFRRTLWWNSAGAASAEERAWLEEKYPGWEQTFGRAWEGYGQAVRENRMDRVEPKSLLLVCAMCHLPMIHRPGTWPFVLRTEECEGREYLFCSEPCRWVFRQEPDRYKGYVTLHDRAIAGDISPPTYDAAVAFMSLTPDDWGSDATNYAWARPTESARKAG